MSIKSHARKTVSMNKSSVKNRSVGRKKEEKEKLPQQKKLEIEELKLHNDNLNE